MGRFVSAVVAAMNEDVWKEVLPQQKGIQFKPASLVIFDGRRARPAARRNRRWARSIARIDQKMYLDTSFFNDMKRKLGGGGDFAYAYVISHEMGHQHRKPARHSAARAAGAAARLEPGESNGLSVRVELMADLLGRRVGPSRQSEVEDLEDGDIQKAINTATAIGDDRLPGRLRACVVPDSFTHGSSEQRALVAERPAKRLGRFRNTFAR